LPAYEVEYSYEVPHYDTLIVNADSIDHAENKALKELDLLPEHIAHINIETIQEVTHSHG
jgi:hypothetical protein